MGEPGFRMRPVLRGAERNALETGRTTREREGWAFRGDVLYTPVRVKPRYWTTETLHGSVIHIATGRGTLHLGATAIAGSITFESYCNGSLQWPRPLSSPADFPDRRLCGRCLEKAHEAESSARATPSTGASRRGPIQFAA